MDDKNIEKMLNKLLTAQSLILGRLLKLEQEKKGVRTTSDHFSEALRLINQKEEEVLRKL